MPPQFSKVSTVQSFFGKISKTEAKEILLREQKRKKYSHVSNFTIFALVRESEDGKIMQCRLYPNQELKELELRVCLCEVPNSKKSCKKCTDFIAFDKWSDDFSSLELSIKKGLKVNRSNVLRLRDIEFFDVAFWPAHSPRPNFDIVFLKLISYYETQ